MEGFAQHVYDELAPVSADDAANANALATFVGSLGDVLFQEVDTYASDGDDGEPGWSIILDIDRIPDKGLEWLAQFVGVQLPPDLSPADKRQRVKETDGWKRGTPEAIRAAAKPYLTGSKNVLIRERYDAALPGGPDAPNKFQVVTYTSQTPDSSKVLAAILLQKPAGLKMTYTVMTGQDWLNVRTAQPTWNDVKIHFATWQEVRDNPAGL